MFRSAKFLCLVGVCAALTAGIAMGAASKIRTFTTYNEPVDADGMAILTIHDGTGQEVQLMVTDFTADTPYVVRMFDPSMPENIFEVGLLDTNGTGNGTFHRDIGTLYPWPCVQLHFCVQVGDHPECELRAQGCIGS